MPSKRVPSSSFFCQPSVQWLWVWEGRANGQTRWTEAGARDADLISPAGVTHQVRHQRSVLAEEKHSREGKQEEKAGEERGGKGGREASTSSSPTTSHNRKKAQLLVWTWGHKNSILGTLLPGYSPTFTKHTGIKWEELCWSKPKRML